MSNLNQFFPSSGGGGGSGGSVPNQIPAEIIVVGGGGYGSNSTNCGCRNPVAPVACGPTFYNASYNAGNGGDTIHAQNYMLRRGQTCPVQVGAGATVLCFVSYSTGSNIGFYGTCQTVAGIIGYGGTSFFGGTTGLCAGGACTIGCPAPTPYQPNAGGICGSKGGTNVSNVQAYDTYIVTNSTISRAILSPTVCVFGSAGAGSYGFTPAGAQCIAFVPSQQMCIGYGATNSGGGASTYSDIAGHHPGYPDTNIPACNGTKAGTVIVKYPLEFGAAPAFPGACDCSPQTPGFYTYRFVSPGCIVLP